jgi:hypothetical protein
MGELVSQRVSCLPKRLRILRHMYDLLRLKPTWALTVRRDVKQQAPARPPAKLGRLKNGTRQAMEGGLPPKSTGFLCDIFSRTPPHKSV